MSDSHQGQKPRLLIVEDDPDIRLGLGVFLRQEFEVSFADDAINCLQVARRESVDAILLDLGLAVGDGLSVLDCLRETPDLADIPVVVLTGREGPGLERECLERGASRFLQKPASHRAVLDALKSSLANRPDRVRVLIVDDDEDICNAMQMILRRKSYEAVAARDGATALMVARKRLPDVILLDLGLPGGGGHSVLKRLKATPELAAIPVIVMTGQSAAEHRRSCFAEGAFSFITKPASAAEILAALEEARCTV